MTLAEIRAKIDALDERVLALLSERAELVHQVGELKRKSGEPYYAPEREEALLSRLVAANKGRLPGSSVRSIYREILSAMRALEQEITVAYLGPQATFSHQAAAAHFGSAVSFAPERTIGDVFEAVERGRAHYGVVPIENSLEGAVNATLDRFMDTTAKICAQLFLPVELNLLGRGPLSSVKKIYSHPQPFGQCRRWLSEHLPAADCVEVASTARAAELASGEETSAAIASSMAGEFFGLPVLAASIQDSPGNLTRFFVVGNQETQPSGLDKTSVMFAVKDQPGALAKALQPFEKAGVSLTRIESRPSKRRPWEYYFFADFAGHAADPSISAALSDLQAVCAFTRILGSYPDSKSS